MVVAQFILMLMVSLLLTTMMAAQKNPKRVAAGKKAARTRAKGKGRSRSRGSNPGRTKKRHVRGISGRVGAVVMGVAPPLIAGMAAAEFASGHHKVHGNIISTVKLGFMQWLNEMGNGLIGVAPFEGPVKFVNKDGATLGGTLAPQLPKGSLLAVMGTGLALLLADRIASFLAGGRATKIPMTNIVATGSS